MYFGSLIRILAIVLVLVCAGGSVSAQHSVSVNYSVEDGLPSNETYEVFQDSKGYIWIGTDRGASRFDGYEFENFTTEDGLPDNTIFGFSEDTLGRIWFKTFNGKLGYYDQGHFGILDQVHLDGWIVDLRIDPPHHFKIHTTLKIYEFDLLKNMDTSNFHEWDSKFQLCETANQAKLLIRKFSTLKGYNFCHGNGTNNLIFYQNEAHLYDSNFHRIKTVILDEYVPEYTQLSDSVLTIYFNQGEKLRKQFTFPGLKLLNVTKMDYKTSSEMEDRFGNYWISTLDRGVLYFPNRKIRVRNRNEAFEEIIVSNGDLVYVDDAGNLMYKNKLIHAIGSRSKFVIDVGGKLFYEGKGVNTYNFSDGKKSKIPTKGKSLAVSQLDSVIWMAGNRQLIKISRREGTLITDKVFRSAYRFDAVSATKDTLWLGTLKGLVVFDVKQQKFTDIFPSPWNTRIKAIVPCRSNQKVLFVASGEKGVLIKNGGKTDQIGVQNGLLSNQINNLYSDADSVLWVATNKGISKITFKSMLPLVYAIENITTTDGLSTNSVNKLCILNDTLYATTIKGINYFHKNISRPKYQLPLFITGVKINNQDTLVAQNYDLSSKQNLLIFKFLGLSYRDKGNLLYKYRLLGADTTWSFTTSANVQFISLSPGDYKFEVMALAGDGNHSLPQTISFTINPPFYYTWWFILCVLTVLSFLIYLLFRYRIKEEREKARILQQATESELKALRAQMNPHFIFNAINSIYLFVQNNNMKDAMKYLTRFSKLMRSTLESSEHDLILIRDEVDSLRNYMELESLRFSNGFDFEIIVDEEIDPGYDEIPSMILQPFVENAIWHGLMNLKKLELDNRKGKVLVEIQVVPEGYRCRIEDNGVGREASFQLKNENISKRVHKSRGMNITDSRLELLRRSGKRHHEVQIADLKDENGKALGTRVEILIFIN